MIDDITKSIKSSLYDRVSSPLFGAFAISWCIWNYKLILVLFSVASAADIINYIETILYASYQEVLLIGVAYPLITSVLFILIYPIPAKRLYQYWHSQQIELKKIKQNIEDETPLTVEESRELRRELLKLESEYEQELNRRGSENDRLREFVHNLENELLNEKNKSNPNRKSAPQPRAKPKSVDTNVDTDQTEIILNLAKAGGYMSENSLISKSPFDKVKTEYLLEDLHNKGYIKYGFISGQQEEGAQLQTSGKKYAVEQGHVK